MFRFSAVVVASLMATPVLAADLYVPAIPEPVMAGGYDWSGGYLGAALGGQGVQINAGAAGNISGNAMMGGIFGGVNFQYGNFVYGVEADLEYSGFNQTKPCTNAVWSCNAYINGQGSLRARLGFAVDTLLFYTTAGLAIANGGGSTTSPVNAVFPDSAVRFGWTAGVGAEVAFNENWFGRLEYRYTDLGSRDMTFDTVYPGVAVSSHDIRGGVGYRF